MATTRPRLTDEIRHAMNDAVTNKLNQLGKRHRLRPLVWSIRQADGGGWRADGYASVDYDPVEVPVVLDTWARWLRLDRVDQPLCPGTVEYRGRVDGLDVELWGVTDRDLFEQSTAQSGKLQ